MGPLTLGVRGACRHHDVQLKRGVGGPAGRQAGTQAGRPADIWLLATSAFRSTLVHLLRCCTVRAFGGGLSSSVASAPACFPAAPLLASLHPLSCIFVGDFAGSFLSYVLHVPLAWQIRVDDLPPELSVSAAVSAEHPVKACCVDRHVPC